MTDKELIASLKESSSDMDLLYNNHLEYCLNFMNKISFNSALNKEIFHDAVILFYEKVKKGNFELNCSIQTYLNSVCRNQILVRLKKESKHNEYSEAFDERIDDWYENDLTEDTKRMQAVLKALEMFRNMGGKCFEILHRYFFENKSMDKIAYELDYTNGDNVKNQKSRCQKQFKEQVFKLLNS